MLFLVICRLKIFSEESVPLFGPPLPSPPVFTDHQEFRDFLLVKCEQKTECIEQGLVASVLELCFMIFSSNQWRKSHTGDTDVCPEASADPRHVDPLALPRPHARPAQGSATFFQTPAGGCWRPQARQLVSCERQFRRLPFYHGQKPQSLLHCSFPPQPPVCLSILHHDWILLQC